MKLLQINVQDFRLFDAIVEYIRQHDPDIITMQEVMTGIFGKYKQPAPCLDQLAALGYQVIYAPNLGITNEKRETITTQGNAILSKHPIVHRQTHFLPQLPAHQTFSADHLQRDFTANPINNNIPRRVRQYLPVGICDAVVQTPNGLLRVLTSHPPASVFCTETLTMMQIAEYIVQLMTNSQPHPTILAGDFNLQPPGYTFDILSQQFTLVTTERINTLNKNVHSGFKSGTMPADGRHVDHVFTKDITVKDRVVEQVDIADHLPVVMNFEM